LTTFILTGLVLFVEFTSFLIPVVAVPAITSISMAVLVGGGGPFRLVVRVRVDVVQCGV